MNTSTIRRFAFLFAASSVAIAAACSDDPAASPSAGIDPGPGTDAATLPPPPGADGGGLDAPAPHPVTFSYHPSWKGVKTVEVFGAFGQSTDWKQAFVTLVDDGTGTFKATAPALANGHYLYIFKATGDEAGGGAAKSDKLVHYAIDPSNAAFMACPKAAPTYSASGNPCSDLTVPQGAPATPFHARGIVQSGGAPIAGYLVEIERDEDDSHHMFANRVTTGADGTFDLAVAAGAYRFQVLHPTFYAMTDAQRTSPETLAAIRRAISSGIKMDADKTINAAEVSYGAYAAMTPRGSATLPTSFTFTVPAGAKARAAVYGPASSIGDPWWVAPYGTATSDEFDGGFNTGKAPDGGLKPDAGYFWGTEQMYAKPDAGGVGWTTQSMVFPIQWP